MLADSNSHNRVNLSNILKGMALVAVSGSIRYPNIKENG